MDLVTFVRNMRLSNFNNEMTLNAYQAYFINKFRKYCVPDVANAALEQSSSEDNSADELASIHDENELTVSRLKVGYQESEYTAKKVGKMTARLNFNDDRDSRIIHELLKPFHSKAVEAE